MATLKIDITAISGSTGTYSRSSGPGTVTSAGDITLNASSGANQDIAWTIDSTLTETFKSTDSFSTAPVPGKGSHNGEFSGLTVSTDAKTLTITDANNANDQYEYSLTLSDGTVLDPKIINR